MADTANVKGTGRWHEWLKKCFRNNRDMIRLCEFIAVLIGVGAIMIEFFYFQQIERDRYRTQTEIELNNSIGLLAVNKNKDVASPYIQNTVTLMNGGGYSMEGIALDGTEFYSVKLAEVPWKNVVFEDVDFDCIQSEERDMQNDDRKTSLCNNLREADFSSAILDDVKFRNADLIDADFSNAYFSESWINDSWASGANFIGAELRGVKISESNFRHAKVYDGTKIRCSVGREDCSELKTSDFSDSILNDVNIRGTEISDSDFTKTYLKKVTFDCDGIKCTKLENVCLKDAKLEEARFTGKDSENRVVLSNVNLSGADLTRAEFENVDISNVDFTGADLKDTDFRNVTFFNVILSESQIDAADFQDEYPSSLESAIDDYWREWRKELSPDVLPCTSEWHQWLNGILPLKP